jgi:hypothetical protein
MRILLQSGLHILIVNRLVIASGNHRLTYLNLMGKGLLDSKLLPWFDLSS